VNGVLAAVSESKGPEMRVKLVAQLFRQLWFHKNRPIASTPRVQCLQFTDIGLSCRRLSRGVHTVDTLTARPTDPVFPLT